MCSRTLPFILRRVVEDVEGDLVANASSAQEIVRRELWQDLVEAVG